MRASANGCAAQHGDRKANPGTGQLEREARVGSSIARGVGK
jgi:hypothetical protein